MKTISIPAATNGKSGVYSERIDLPGFSIGSATAAFSVRIGNEPAQDGAAGKSFGSETGDPLGRVTFENSGAAPVDVTLGGYAPNTASTRPGATRTTASSGTVDTVTPATFGDLSTGFQTGRKMIYISNVDTANKLAVFIYPAGGPRVVAGRVQFLNNLTLETDATIQLLAVSNNADYAVLETFYA